MKNNEDGFSLAEVLVAAGLLGVLGVVINFGTQQVGQMTKESMQQKVVHEISAENMKTLKNASEGIVWQKFNFEQTYKADGSLVDWKLEDIEESSIADLQTSLRDSEGNVLKLTRSSHTLVSAKFEKKRALLTRCVPKNRYNNKKRPIETDDIASFDRVPFIKDEKLYCCPQGSAKICDEAVNQKSSRYRIMTFSLSEGKNLKVLPVWGNRKMLLGSGFIFYIGEGKKPEEYSFKQFVITNACFKREKDCTQSGIISFREGIGHISSRSIYDSGQLIIE